ncbi:xylulokinase [Fodinisporobacter ferrooxydans]|uniref:Xylulose kinase n=1 Tax=Fodinisporobacter ferrooxydans TaxID=2901836 RepID=A0ABY4CK90_9BACL|nr:xylulokinase [Alicyclobacillaceae bacterium MYW30-H2]
MSLFIGIDLGTSSVKSIVVDETGSICANSSREYPLLNPQPLWYEQDPEIWWKKTKETIQELIQHPEVDASDIKGIGLSGQMHGTVFLDKNGKPLYNAILWCDQRTEQECEYIEQKVGIQSLVEESGNRALTGFSAPKILWVKQNKPEIYEKVDKVLLPKDYIRYRLTGEFATEVSDASGTLLLQVKKRNWSNHLLESLNIPREWLPNVYESQEVTGYTLSYLQKEIGLPAGTPVVGGGGDQAAGAVGSGVVEGGIATVALGTSGVVFVARDDTLKTFQHTLHFFCHAVPDQWHTMGVMLSAAASLKWWKEISANQESYETILQEADHVRAGSEGLLFLPYLVGERTPHPDPQAKGQLVGLTLAHQRAHITRAILEGVGFGLNDSLQMMNDVEIKEIRVTGGGSKNKIWRQILADIFNKPIATVNTNEGPAYGAAVLAAVGSGGFASVKQVTDQWIQTLECHEPIQTHHQVYSEIYQIYKEQYSLLKHTFHQLDAFR